MREWILSSGEDLELVHVTEAGFDGRLEHRAFAEVVKRRELQHIEIGLKGIVEVECVGERLSVIFRYVKITCTVDQALCVKVLETWIGDAGGRIQAGRS